ncbi:MAG: TolB family protein, partial [Planctomycetota bacterium]
MARPVRPGPVLTATASAILGCLALGASARAAGDVLIADFEGGNYGRWRSEGDAFGRAPAAGTLPGQQRVHGFLGKGLVNTFLKADGSRGKLTSPEFKIERRYINFLIGGGSHMGTTCMDLMVGGKVVRSSTGHDNEELRWSTWDVGKLKGRKARIRIVDDSSGGWGHVNVDHIVQSDRKRDTPRGNAVEGHKLNEAELATLAEMIEGLGFGEIVFSVRQDGKDGHWYANFSNWSSNPKRYLYSDGGRLCRLDLKTGEAKTILDAPGGGVRDPQVHYSGKKILFSYRTPGQHYYHLHEINVDGTGLRRITDGPFDDLEPAYLPDGGIVFTSSRCNRMVNCWHTRVAIVYRCDADGRNMRPLSCNIEQDNTPWVLPDGRIIYQRWEYIDRSQVRYHHLWTMNPDGTNQMVYYGNMHGSTLYIDAKPIPGTKKVVASFSPGHG